MIIGKRLKRLWTLLTTEEVFHEDGTSAARYACRPGVRAHATIRGAGPVQDPGPSFSTRATVQGVRR
jgi:hypothetical protein